MSHERQSPDKKTEEARAFLEALKTGDLDAVRRMIQGNRNLLFITDDYYGSPVRAATDTHPEIADFLARIELRRLGEGSVPEDELYGAIHDLGEAAHSETGYRGCESLRAEAEPVVAGYLTHNDPEIRYIAMSVLTTHWGLTHYARAFMSMSQSDPDEFVRKIAISNVGSLLRGSRDRDASRILLEIFRDPVQPAGIRGEAYESLVEIWQGYDAAYALFVRRQKDLRWAEAERAGEGFQAAENAWEEFIDWNFVAQVEQELKEGN